MLYVFTEKFSIFKIICALNLFMEMKQYRVLVRFYKFYNYIYCKGEEGSWYAYLREKSERTQLTD